MFSGILVTLMLHVRENPGNQIFIPVGFIHDEKQPDNLFNDGHDKEGKKEQPNDQIDPLIKDIDWQHAETVMIDDGPTGTINFQSTLRHSRKYCVERVLQKLLIFAQLIGQDLDAIGEEGSLEVAVDHEDVEDDVDKVEEVTEDEFCGPATVASKEVLRVDANVSNFVISSFMIGDDIVEVLDEAGDSVVVGELVEHVGNVEGGGL